MTRRILLTGADGFIGTRLAVRLAQSGWDVTGFSLVDGHIARDPLPEAPGAERAVHLAAAMFVPDSWKNPADFYEINVLGTVRVLEWCRARGASLTYISSYVYGEPRYLPIDEQHPVAATNPYAHTKLMAEDVCRFYAERFEVPVCIVRPFNIYGPSQRGPWLVPTLVEQALAPGGDVISVADTRPRRDYLYVDDLVELLALTCDKDVRGLYNAASGLSVSIGELVTLLARFTGAKRVESRGEERPGEIFDVVGDASRARRDFGWTPKVSLEEGLRRVVEARRMGR